MEFRVRWKDLWRSLAKYMTVVIVVSIVGALGVRFVFSGFTHESLFQHLSPLKYIYLFVAIWLACEFFALLIALWARMASVKVENETLFGRNYWGLKKAIPSKEIKALDFSAIVVLMLLLQMLKNLEKYLFIHKPKNWMS